MTAPLSDLPARPARPAMAMKWAVVLGALALATVIDGIPVADMGKPVENVMIMPSPITLPSDRCQPGCSIMVASNQSGDAFTARPQ